MSELSNEEEITAPELTADELRLAYEQAVRSRAVEEHIVRLASRGEVKFAIWGPGEEVHGAATALALSKVVGPNTIGLVPHYRSGCMVGTWCKVHGDTEFHRNLLRQQFSKDTDPMTRGRQMVYHLDLPDYGILPVQSPVGMQLGKAAGYALGFKKKGVTNALTMGIIGDGTSAEGDLHDTMNAASVWELPTIVMVTDNGVAISTGPEDGRGIKDFEAYARGFGIAFFSCNGTDFQDVYETTYRCARFVVDNQKPAFFHVHSLPRFNGHSSAADMTFDLSQEDPIIGFGQQLVAQGVLDEADIMKRIEGTGRDFFALRAHPAAPARGQRAPAWRRYDQHHLRSGHPSGAGPHHREPQRRHRWPGRGAAWRRHAGHRWSAQASRRQGHRQPPERAPHPGHGHRAWPAQRHDGAAGGAVRRLQPERLPLAGPPGQHVLVQQRSEHQQAADAHPHRSLRWRRAVPLDEHRRLLHAHPRSGHRHAQHQLGCLRPDHDGQRVPGPGRLPRAQVDVPPDPGAGLPR